MNTKQINKINQMEY